MRFAFIVAEKTFQRLDAPELLADVASGVVYVNGVRAMNRRDDKAAAYLIYTLLDKTSGDPAYVQLPLARRHLVRPRVVSTALNSLVNARRFRLAMTHSYRTFVRSGVSTKPGQVQARPRTGSTAFPTAMARTSGSVTTTELTTHLYRGAEPGRSDLPRTSVPSNSAFVPSMLHSRSSA